MFYYNLRVAHREPAHPDAHVHVLPALQVPPFEQTGVQTAKKQTMKVVQNLFLLCAGCSEVRMNVQRTCCTCCPTPIGCTTASIGSNTDTTISTCSRAYG